MLNLSPEPGTAEGTSGGRGGDLSVSCPSHGISPGPGPRAGRPSGAAHLSPPVAVQDLRHLLEPQDGVLHAEEQGPLPVDRAGHGGVVLVQRRAVEVLREDFIDGVDLESNPTRTVSGKRRRSAKKHGWEGERRSVKGQSGERVLTTSYFTLLLNFPHILSIV